MSTFLAINTKALHSLLGISTGTVSASTPPNGLQHCLECVALCYSECISDVIRGRYNQGESRETP